jgi:copper resistance protein B
MKLIIMVIGASFAATSPSFGMETAKPFHMVRAEVDASQPDGEDVLTWDGEAWIGGDRNKIWFKSEGDVVDGKTESAEVQALWSRNIAPFWDSQIGVRVDVEPDTTTYLAVGLQGLSPYQFETEATAFVSERGDLSARFRQSLDLLFTQRLILEPHVEINAFGQDVAAEGIGAGLSDIEAGLQLRYEITRKFAPYLDLTIVRALGETAQITRSRGGDPEEAALRAGVRFWF